VRKRAAVTFALAIALAIPLAPVASGTSHAYAMPAIGSTTSTAAADASREAKSLRRDVASMLQNYVDDYRDRFSDAETRQLLAYKADADRQLAAILVTTGWLQQATSPTATSAARRAAGQAAQSAWRRARAKATTTFDSARQITEPRLSWWEKLSAQRDYNTMMSRYDELGALIDKAAAS
jgi:hypothetical protein